MEKAERVRTKNFNSKEIELLVELVQAKRNVLENKESGVVSNKQKKLAWVALAEEFNARSGNFPRMPKNLRDKWGNLKKTAVRNYAADKKYKRGTGGGPNKVFIVEPIENVINDILGKRRTGMQAICDNDAVAVNPPSEDVLNVSSSEKWIDSLLLEEEALENRAIAGKSIADDACIKSSPASTSTTVSQVLGKERVGENTTNAKWCDLVDAKKTTAELKQKFLFEENQRKQEIHELIKQQMTEEHEQKLRHREEEHQLKMDLLKREHEIRIKNV